MKEASEQKIAHTKDLKEIQCYNQRQTEFSESFFTIYFVMVCLQTAIADERVSFFFATFNYPTQSLTFVALLG
jgi:hypothetical protein